MIPQSVVSHWELETVPDLGGFAEGTGKAQTEALTDLRIGKARTSRDHPVLSF